MRVSSIPRNKPERKKAILPYNITKIGNKYLLSTPLNTWSILSKSQFKRLHAFLLDKPSPLLKKLRDDGIVVDEDNLTHLEENYRKTNASLFYDVGLHIAVVTERCNFSCVYCQTKSQRGKKMGLEVANGILGFLSSGNHPSPHLEFQGGEPLLNWEIVKYLIKGAKEYVEKEDNRRRNLRISLVSNLSLLDDEKIKFLLDNDVDICTSLDGPPKLHDKNRVFEGGRPTYKVVAGKIEKINNEYRKRNIKHRVNLLPTITKESLSYPKEIIDEYLKWEVGSIPLRYVNRLGRADKIWREIGYTPEEFNKFWEESMEYILELNKRGINLAERTALVMLKKIFKKEDPGYVDLCSPCGAGRNVLTYMPNGDIYSCDEARMIRSSMFKLGNVKKDKYSEVTRNPNIFYILGSSLLDFWDYNSAYAIWSGTCPVLNYYEQENVVVKIRQTSRYKIYDFQFNYLFKKIAKDKEAVRIFRRWVETH